MMTSGAAVWLLVILGLPGAEREAQRATPESRAVAFLTREVPRWSRENHCFSCHNNGDAARALYAAASAGYRLPADALADTTGWLSQPASWDHNGGDGPFSDKRLARVVFTGTLAVATRTGRVRDRVGLVRAAETLSIDQAADGSWRLEGEDAVSSPATYGRGLATYMARESLAAADSVRFRAAIARADGYLSRRDVVTMTDASVSLLSAAAGGASASAKQSAMARDLLRRGQAADGGWGPYVDSPPEAFHTALAVIALAGSADGGQIRRMIAAGRGYLIARQQDDGSWIETTQPPGAESYAQRISTSGWATLALLATSDSSSPSAGLRLRKPVLWP
jgi:hypothetical protein